MVFLRLADQGTCDQVHDRLSKNDDEKNSGNRYNRTYRKMLGECFPVVIPARAATETMPWHRPHQGPAGSGDSGQCGF